MSRPLLLSLAVGLAGSLLASQAPPPGFRLDQQASAGGVAFGQAATAIPGFAAQFRKQGRPRLRTQLYKRLQDTTQLGGLGRPDSYWFRQGQFIGIDFNSCRKQAPEQALQALTVRYGPPQADTLAGEFYWLGQRTFILLETPKGHSGGCTSVLIGSLAMLNELVRESSVRARARQLLRWQPDSLGLPRQLPRR
ncbi:hypothetical protein [Hymenobacter cheonanensis]|uniref:hypothetical protein n=1 Tax=Hymenobacter sp. CA2-7 TaxID=3063993 RepID=UPI002712CA8E|nr:hypothetical protein [Hymenobacter sp. CA2-7]MDO7887887.1 hypothetical protein [Hymenobacter sp. CA2-7]